MNIRKALLKQVKKQPDKEIIYEDPSNGWTYRNLFNAARSVARKLKESPDGRVGLLMQRPFPFAASLFGTLFSGRVPVPLNYYLGSESLSYISRQAGLSLVLGDGSVPEKMKAVPVKSVSFFDISPKPENNPEPINSKRVSEPGRPVSDDFSFLLFTSGTTGHPKGVKLTQQNILSNIRSSRKAMALQPEDHFLSSLPLFHSFGLTCGLLMPLLTGISTTVEPSFSPKRVLTSFSEQKVTIYLAVPSQYRALSKTAKEKSMQTPFHNRQTSIRLISGGEPLPEPIRETIETQFDRPMLEGYGLTETSPVISVNRLDRYKPGTAGIPIDNVEVRIADKNQPHQLLENGVEGEIQVNGPSVMQGYLNQEQQDQSPFSEDGWFRTGDLGKLDGDGFLHVTGRIKELIISAGENIAPARIEEQLLQHEEIDEAAVIGVSDTKRGEVPVAFVSPVKQGSVDPHDLKTTIRERIGRNHVPAEIYVQDQLPHGPTGKILKRKLREFV